MLDPKNDVVFKMLFTRGADSEIALISLLTAILKPSSPIVRAFVRNPEIPREFIDVRGVVLDLLVELNDGRQIDVEMQSRKHSAFRERTLLYWAKTYSAQLAPGDRYDELRPVVSILILDFVEFRGKRLHSRFELLETHELERFSDNVELHVLELPKLAHARASELAAEPGVLSWSKFFSVQSDEQLEALAMADPGIDKAKQILERLSADPQAREAARIRERAEINVKLMNAAERRAGREEGLAEGRQEGLAEGRQEGLAEGLLSAARTAVLDVLEARGIPLSDAARQRIEASCDLAQLHAWHRAAIRVASVDALWT